MERPEEIKEYDDQRFEKIKVLVETAERGFKGYVYKLQMDEAYRLSDYLNTYDRRFLCLTDVEVHDRGQDYRVHAKKPFVAISLASITYVAPVGTSD